MNIVDSGELKAIEPLPAEETLYLSALRYMATGRWVAGPSASDKAALIKMVQQWGGVDEVRIYAVRVPCKMMDA